MTSPARSWLYVPGSRPDRVAKALVAGADAVVVDLEDSVAPRDKASARMCAVDIAQSRRPGQGPQLWVRVNDPEGTWGSDDLQALCGAPLDGLRIPRAQSPSTIRDVAHVCGLPLQLLVETAAGLMQAHELATAHPLVTGIGLGEADLAADLRVLSDDGLVWARGIVVAAARAAGLDSPVQSVWTDVADTTGLRESTLQGYRTGFFGRSVVHPRQIPVVHDVFSPTPQEVAEAEAVVATFETAQRQGEGAVLDDRGRLLDPAVVDRARLVLRLRDLTSPSPDQETT